MKKWKIFIEIYFKIVIIYVIIGIVGGFEGV